MPSERLARLKATLAGEARSYLHAFVYLWVLLTVLSLHKAYVFNEDMLTYQQGFALLNALALAKIVVVAQKLRAGERISKNLPAIYVIIVKSAVFAVIVIVFHVVEETLIGMWRGEALREAVPTLGDGTLQALVMLSLIVFVAFIPFFAYLEIEKAVGADRLRAFLFGRRVFKA